MTHEMMLTCSSLAAVYELAVAELAGAPWDDEPTVRYEDRDTVPMMPVAGPGDQGTDFEASYTDVDEDDFAAPDEGELDLGDDDIEEVQ